jgi:hypothetical protein
MLENSQSKDFIATVIDISLYIMEARNILAAKFCGLFRTGTNCRGFMGIMSAVNRFANTWRQVYSEVQFLRRGNN